MPSNRTVPEAYQGREQALIKHRLLEAYLQQLFLVIGMGADRLWIRELCYVDCFAGPWGDETEKLESTSIAISSRILDTVRQELAKHGKTLRFRALYVERNPAKFARLQRYLQEQALPGVATQAMLGDFVDLRTQILEWCGRDPFVFFFIDPTAWTPVGVNVLKPLLQRPRSEFLINFMYDFVARAASMADFEQHMVKLLGEAPDVKELHGEAREKRILDIYRRNLKHAMSGQWRARSAYVRVLDPEKERPKYHLVYLTSHPLGIIEFMEISETLDQIQKRVRAAAKQDRRIKASGQEELFESDELPTVDAEKASIERVEQYWLQYLSRQPKRVGREEFADILEDTDWFPGDLQRALGNLIAKGKVVNLDAKGKRRKNFLHFDKAERLQITEKSA